MSELDEEITQEEERRFFEASLLFMLGQLYDVQMMLLSRLAGEEVATDLHEMHRKGMLFQPPPFGMTLDEPSTRQP